MGSPWTIIAAPYRLGMSDDKRTLLAVLPITRTRGVKVGDAVSLGIDFVSRRDADSGTKIVTSLVDIREVSIALASAPALKSAKVLSVGQWRVVPDDPAEQADLAATGGDASAWKAAGLPVGHSSGNYGGSVPVTR